MSAYFLLDMIISQLIFLNNIADNFYKFYIGVFAYNVIIISVFNFSQKEVKLRNNY